MPQSPILGSIIVIAALCGVVGGCASAPVADDDIANAELAIRAAEQARGQQYAPLQMRIAREKLEEAKASARAKQNEQARRLAEEAVIEAQLAEAMAGATRASATKAEAEKTINTLRDELGMSE